ncbi:hypothetical protein FB192DRAFT_1461661 [Mucor lusitanicus]|uniref:Uncharacterized protein n=2 Tax=Mucor circinelloides f. lusitanicus TaxID=29924 RepID=A0A168NVG8_MUCCL|nr:hypothetical protein FB192DRAFT_1461661 [Mucor lusitanicus]OAD06795.1 hypothetical protein MUCCIDRAFT_107386 [Mucor lusitanicus CBS 277.49]
MIDYNRKKNDDNSILSNDSHSLKSVWNRLSHLFHTSEDSNRRLSTSSNESDLSTRSSCSIERRTHNRRRKLLVEDHSSNSGSRSSTLVIPPFSPTYCKANEFPYSNFYVKLPNGKWMVRYRSGNRDILGTDEFEGYMI